MNKRLRNGENKKNVRKSVTFSHRPGPIIYTVELQLSILTKKYRSRPASARRRPEEGKMSSRTYIWLVIGINLSLICGVCLFANIDSAQPPSADDNSAVFLLNKMIENRNKVRNFECVNEALEFRSVGYRQALYNQVMETGHAELAQKHLSRSYIITIQKLAFDNRGRARVENTSGTSDSKGNMIEVDTKSTVTWDGDRADSYEERPGKNPVATIGLTEQPVETSKKYRQPWRSFGGHFCDNLADAIKQNREINVEKLENGKYRVEILYPSDMKRTGIIDPAQGYSVTSEDLYDQGRVTAGYDARYREVEPGIWFPVEGKYFNGYLTDPYNKVAVKIKDVRINDPDLSDNMFHVNFAEGTFVVHMGKPGVFYKWQGGKLVDSDGRQFAMDEVYPPHTRVGKPLLE